MADLVEGAVEDELWLIAGEGPERDEHEPDDQDRPEAPVDRTLAAFGEGVGTTY